MHNLIKGFPGDDRSDINGRAHQSLAGSSILRATCAGKSSHWRTLLDVGER